MVSDRGTLPRGAVDGQQAPWAEPTAPAGRRLPTVPRERKPVLAALAVLLVALGAAAAGLLVVKAGHRVPAVEIAQEVGPGAQIPASAVREVDVAADSGVDYVAWAYAGRVAGLYATTTILPGTLLTPAMTSTSSGLATGRAEVGLALKPGQEPGDLVVGDSVQAFPVGTGSGCGTGGSGLPVATGTVAGLAGGAASGGTTAQVTLAVPQADAGPLACLASAGDVAITLLPASGAG